MSLGHLGLLFCACVNLQLKINVLWTKMPIEYVLIYLADNAPFKAYVLGILYNISLQHYSVTFKYKNAYI